MKVIIIICGETQMRKTQMSTSAIIVFVQLFQEAVYMKDVVTYSVSIAEMVYIHTQRYTVRHAKIMLMR